MDYLTHRYVRYAVLAGLVLCLVNSAYFAVTVSSGFWIGNTILLVILILFNLPLTRTETE